MSIFSEVKDMVTMKQVAEYYGLKVNGNGMACCPFHDDRHPSMKIYSGYHCFACGAHGDAIGYVAQLFHMSQYEAACKIIKDLHLLIDAGGLRFDAKGKSRWRKEQEDRKKLDRIKDRFRLWCDMQTGILRDRLEDVSRIKEHFHDSTPEEVFSSQDYEEVVRLEPVINYWMDILCLGLEQERIELFIEQREEVEQSVDKITGAVERILGKGRTDNGFGNEQHGRYTA
jgi:hypothetical protein